MSELWYREPAGEWEAALPIGNGRLGAMVFGRVCNEQIQVNEESMWYGGHVNRINPDFKQNLPIIRQLLDEGEIYKAERLMEEAMSGCPESEHPYQTLGDLLFFYQGLDQGKITDYKRSLNLDTAVTRVEFLHEGTVYTREIFASHPADCIVMRLTAQGAGKIHFICRMRRASMFDGVSKYGNKGISLYGNLGRGGLEFRSVLSAEAKDGEVTVVGEHLKVTDASEVTLFFSADTTNQYIDGSGKEKLESFIEKYVTEHTEPSIEGLTGFQKKEYIYQDAMQAFLAEQIDMRLKKAEKCSYDSLLEEHIRDYRNLYDRFEFRLEHTEEYDKIATDVRLKAASEGQVDPGLSELLFDFGRYLTISGSRKGTLPTNLQGIWNKDFFPAWDSKYTININAEMNYWHVESCNLSECHEPFFELLRRVRVNGRKTARQMYGCRGFMAHHNTDFYGDTAPQDIWHSSSYWTLGAAWMSTHLWTHYLHTKDRDFLVKAFPVMAEAALFFVDFLIERNGYLVTSPTVSPENVYILPNGQQGACCIGATMDNQILRHLFSACLDAWKELGGQEDQLEEIPDVDSISELMEQIENCMERLHPVRISDSGRIMEWPEDYEEAEPGHRHISHLYGLYPAGQITVDETPELAKAAERTLEYRLAHGGGHTGWSRAWIINHYASLWNGAKAYENIEKMLGLSSYPNMFDKHPPFQIDGNFGVCAGICQMLVQSNRHRTVLLPALAPAWMDGSVRGLRLVGNAELSMTWRDGKLTEAKIQADSDYQALIKYGDQQFQVSLKKGESKDLPVL